MPPAYVDRLRASIGRSGPRSCAALSACRTYRYRLVRVWDPNKPPLAWVTVTGSDTDDYRAIGFARAWGYGGISPASFMSRLQNSVDLSDFFVGLIKAPFMALVIGLIAATEGFNVAGSAESLGHQVTASVVKSIFMVIVVDGIFSIFFSSIRF